MVSPILPFTFNHVRNTIEHNFNHIETTKPYIFNLYTFGYFIIQ